MQKSRATTIPMFVDDRVVRHSLTNDIFLVIGASFLLALSAMVSVPIPFSPVPMTLQPLAILLLGGALGSTRAAMAAALYLFEGAMGLPVFHSGAAGLGHLMGPTAGYLVAFPAAAWVAGYAADSGWTRSIVRTVAAMAAALAVIHLGGWSWLSTVYGLGPAAAFLTGTAPFLFGDVVKLVIAAALLPTAHRIVEAAGGSTD